MRNLRVDMRMEDAQDIKLRESIKYALRETCELVHIQKQFG